MLSHIKVIDLTEGLGASAGRMLAELGADVLKVEPPDGDRARLPTHASVPDANASWIVFNAGKRGTVLDLQSPAGRQAFLGLVAEADILVRGHAEIPFAHEALAERNPRLIDVVVAPFDSSGESASRPATDLTLLARSGLMAIIGDPDRAPLKLPGEQAYALAGIQGAIAALTALYARHASGKGQLVRVSAFQSAVLANYREPLMWQWAGRIGNRTGNLLVRGKSGVRQVWPCLDGYVTWSFVDNPGMMRALVRVMKEHGGGDALAGINWDATLVADVPREMLIEWERSVEAFFLLHSKAKLAELSVANGFGLSGIDAAQDVLGSEQLRYRGLWRQLDDPARNLSLQVPGPLFLSSAGTAAAVRAAPLLPPEQSATESTP